VGGGGGGGVILMKPTLARIHTHTLTHTGSKEVCTHTHTHTHTGTKTHTHTHTQELKKCTHTLTHTGTNEVDPISVKVIPGANHGAEGTAALHKKHDGTPPGQGNPGTTVCIYIQTVYEYT
jgi:hypothetical protein